MLLKKIIKNLQDKKAGMINIKNLSLDSRITKKGDLFFAIEGSKLSGEKFINEAINNGALAIVCSNNYKKKNFFKVPIIKCTNVKKILVESCKKFYNKKPKNLIAVTGTNGKSSVADFFFQILSLNKYPVATIGTLGIKSKKKIKKINLTSPDIITLHRELQRIKESKIDNVVIEASSHGLSQGRLDGLNIKCGIFTNFTQDHLDYHKTMKKYFSDKMILFSNILKKNQYIITDKNLEEFSKIRKISTKRKLKLLSINDDELETLKNKVNLIGNFQLKNLLMAMKAAEICSLKKNKIFSSINKIKGVKGRLELIRNLPNGTKVFIDYAHTPDALKTVLNSLSDYFKKEITLVFGCGGERDKKKRRIMSEIAKHYSNNIYVTDDNPRKENPKKIRKEIIKYLSKDTFHEIANRKDAIQTSLRHSKSEEIILVAGKGHENYQDYGNKIIFISDKNIINKTKIKFEKTNKKLINLSHNLEILNEVFGKKLNLNFNNISTNSKKIKKNDLFIALKGKHKDGHNFINESIKNGAKICIISQKTKKKSNKLLKVKNSYSFLYNFAKTKRAASKAKIIAITGSSGKTTLKTMLGKLLLKYSETYYSPQSFNNNFGVPISLSNLRKTDKFGVFEVGMNKPGEINKLTKLIKPNIGIITNIAEAHIENFKNLKGIANAKSEIINNITTGGYIILNRDDKFFNYLNNIASKKKINIISYGFSKLSDIQLAGLKKLKKQFDLKIRVFNKVINIKSKKINFYNILSSIAVLKVLGLDLKKIENFFSNFDLVEGRGKVHKIKRFHTNFKLIDESYNANPFSTKNAIISLSNIKKKNFKKYLLLGDMLELGDKSNFYHKDLSKVINKSNIDKLFVYGDKILNTYKYTKHNMRGNILQNMSDFDEIFSSIIKDGDYIMIKGSNATGLNMLSKKIIKGLNNVV